MVLLAMCVYIPFFIGLVYLTSWIKVHDKYFLLIIFPLILSLTLSILFTIHYGTQYNTLIQRVSLQEKRALENWIIFHQIWYIMKYFMDKSISEFSGVSMLQGLTPVLVFTSHIPLLYVGTLEKVRL